MELWFCPFCTWLLLACCLLAACLLAKPGRCTLDTKEGCKTKTRSTRSVTLTGTGYWGRAGGERNITFKAFCDFRWAKIAYNGLKTGSFHLFMDPKRSSYHFGKTRFWTHLGCTNG